MHTSGKILECYYPKSEAGCVMLPWIDGTMREAKENLQGGVQLPTTNVQMLLFMDDIVMVTEKKDSMQRNLDEMKKVMNKWGMKMHLGENKSDDSEQDRRV